MRGLHNTAETALNRPSKSETVGIGVMTVACSSVLLSQQRKRADYGVRAVKITVSFYGVAFVAAR
jgi:hypothetical protein